MGKVRASVVSYLMWAAIDVAQSPGGGRDVVAGLVGEASQAQ